ncbi:hypothetical protein ACSBR1_002586 [Camellia fascicularis]
MSTLPLDREKKERKGEKRKREERRGRKEEEEKARAGSADDGGRRRTTNDERRPKIGAAADEARAGLLLCLLILGGSDTTTATLTWAVSLLLNHPIALKTAQQEIDMYVGHRKVRWVDESDTTNLVYLQAIVKETLRLYPPGPLSIPRESIQGCQVSGYYVPKGTCLIVNVWKLHRDPCLSTNPDEFRPERFLTWQAKADLRGQQFEFLPFGAGRRSCPGSTLAY